MLYNVGRPETQISGNGSPFLSKTKTEFPNQNNMKLQKIAQLHPLSNTETSGENNEKDVLEVLLNS